MPLAYVMGVEWDDAFEVGKLLGVKTFLNEFVAYQELAKLIKNREDGLAGPTISVSIVSVVKPIISCSCLIVHCSSTIHNRYHYFLRSSFK